MAEFESWVTGATLWPIHIPDGMEFPLTPERVIDVANIYKPVGDRFILLIFISSRRDGYPTISIWRVVDDKARLMVER